MSIQKGCTVKVPGCWEHMPLVWKERKAAKTNEFNLSAVWLDLATAYSSVPHQFILFALDRYAIDTIWVDLLKSYSGGLWRKSFSPTAPST